MGRLEPHELRVIHLGDAGRDEQKLRILRSANDAEAVGVEPDARTLWYLGATPKEENPVETLGSFDRAALTFDDRHSRCVPRDRKALPRSRCQLVGAPGRRSGSARVECGAVTDPRGEALVDLGYLDRADAILEQAEAAIEAEATALNYVGVSAPVM